MSELTALAAHVRALSVAHRAWFWMCTHAEPLPLLLLAPFRSDPHMRQIKAKVSGLKLPVGVRPTLGLCFVGEDGVFRFAAERATPDTLGALAAFVREHAETHPDFRRLVGARMLLTDEKFNARATVQDDALWAGITPTEAPGSLDDTVATIHRMAPGERAWFWATDRGPGGKPFLLVEPVSPDTSVSTLNKRVEGALRRTWQLGATVRGLIGCERDGSMTVHTEQSEKRTRTVFRALGNADRHLRWMLRPRPAPADDLSQTFAALADAQDGEQGLFFAAIRPKEGDLFLLAPDKEALKAQMKALKLSPRAGLVGDYRFRKGRFTLALPAPSATVLPTVARWVAQHHDSVPAAERLRDACAVVLNGDGDAVQHIRDDRAWSFLSADNA